MKKLLFILLIVSGQVSADLAQGTPLFTFTPPTQFTDNTALVPATDLDRYDLTCSGLPTITIPPTATSYQSTAGEFPPGPYGCNLTAVATVAKGGQASVSAPLVSFTVPAVVVAAPNPVTGQTVQ